MVELLAGESGARRDHRVRPHDYNVHFACELKEFDPTVWIDRKAARRMDRFAQMILAAARQAEADSGIEIAKEPDRFGASIATGIGGLQSYQDCYHVLLTRGPDRVSPFSIPSIIPNMGAGWVSIEFGTKGPLMSECTACAASNMAIGDAMDEIRHGPRRRDVRRRHRSADHRGRDRRLRRDARALAPERRPRRGVTAVRQDPATVS